MIENIQAIYKNGVLHSLNPLDLPEDKIVEIDVGDEISIAAETHRDKVFQSVARTWIDKSAKFSGL